MKEKSGQNKEPDGSLWIRGLLASRLLLSERPHTVQSPTGWASTTIALFIQLFLSVRVSISPALAFQTNQSISAERPEGKTTRRAASSSLGLAVLPFLPHRPPPLFLSPFSSSRAPFFCHPCFLFSPPSLSLQLHHFIPFLPQASMHHFHQPAFSSPCFHLLLSSPYLPVSPPRASDSVKRWISGLG